MKNCYEMMRIGSVATKKIDDRCKRRDREIAQQQKYVEPLRSKNIKEINDQFDFDLRIIREKMMAELALYNKDATAVVRRKLSTAPTDEEMRLLKALGQLEYMDHRLADLYIPEVSRTVLGQMLMSQIMAKHQMMLPIPNVEQLLKAPEIVHYNVATYIQNYAGPDSINSVMIKELHDHYFQPEDVMMKFDIGSSENAIMHFWNEKVGIGTPDLLDDDAPNAKNYKARYVFTDMDGVIAFMNEKTKGLEGEEKTAMENELLEHFPDTYAVQYRYYLATGKKSPLIEERITTDQDEDN